MFEKIQTTEIIAARVPVGFIPVAHEAQDAAYARGVSDAKAHFARDAEFDATLVSNQVGGLHDYYYAGWFSEYKKHKETHRKRRKYEKIDRYEGLEDEN